MADSTDVTKLTAYSYVTLVIFICVIMLVIRPIKFRIGPYIKIYLNIATVPPLGVLILLICRAIDFDIVKRGFLGTMGVQPWAILILFYSLAYICISLDMTGIFQFCAFWVSKKAGNRGMLAFTLFFILTSVMSGLTSNDVVILTGTVFLSYFTKVSDIRPTAFLMSEFTTANIASMALYIGNPTNVVVSEAYGISFISYSAWMLLPTFVCILLAYVVLRILFRSHYYLPRTINPPDAEPRSVLIDPHGAIFGLILLACCLITLVATSFVSVPVWMVTLPFACVMFIRDIRHDLGISFSHILNIKRRFPRPFLHTAQHDQVLVYDEDKHPSVAEANDDKGEGTNIPLPILKKRNSITRIMTNNTTTTELNHHGTAALVLSNDQTTDIGTSPLGQNHVGGIFSHQNQARRGEEVLSSLRLRSGTPMLESQPLPLPIIKKTATPIEENPSARMTTSSQNPTRLELYFWTPLYHLTNWFGTHFPTLKAVFLRMPWAILPFSLGMFILIETLSEKGWVGIFATAMAIFAKNYATAVLGTVFVSILACQLLNNLPMTILFTQIIQHPNFTQHVHDDATMQGFLLGLIVGSNLGACLTQVGSLAGIMFDHILKTKGIYTLGYFQFLKWNLAILPLIALGACAVLIGEIWFIYLR